MCTCTDCAIDNNIIEQVLGSASETFLTEDGDVCVEEHDHEGDEAECEIAYMCESCGEYFDSESDAENCCFSWMCTECGSPWASKYDAAHCCATSCSYCGTEGWPSTLDFHDCDEDERDDDGYGSMRATTPWAERGIMVDARCPVATWEEVWELDPAKHNVVQAAADFYLLEAISAGLVGTTDGKGHTVISVGDSSTFKVITNEARDLLQALVREWDPILQSYVHIAVGGELRHHSALGGVVSSNRNVAWAGWKMIFEAVGPQALADASELFLEFTGGSFGGTPWALAADILYARITGKITPHLFLDRVFNAEHNGGCLLNKVRWAGDQTINGVRSMPLYRLSDTVLPAHGVTPEPDYQVLLQYASDEVRALYVDAFEYASHAAVEMGQSLATRAPRISLPIRPWIEAARAAAAKKAQTIAEAKKSTLEKYESLLANYRQMAKEAYTQLQVVQVVNAEIEYAFKAGEIKQACKCGDSECMIGIPGYVTHPDSDYKYYVGMVATYKSEIQKHKEFMDLYGPEQYVCEACQAYSYCVCDDEVF